MSESPDIAVTRYALIQRLLHWVIALLVIAALTLGITIDRMGFEGLQDSLGRAATDLIYTYHKTFGILIVLLMLLRLALRLILGKPAYAEPLPPPQRIASSAVHGLFYVLLLVQPVLGWLATATGGFPVQFFNMNPPGLIGENEALSETLFRWHGMVGWTILTLAIIHIAAALYHWLIRRDGVMKRMSLF